MRVAPSTERAAAVPGDVAGCLDLDEATLALERLVRDTHAALVRDGLLETDSVGPRAGPPRLSATATSAGAAPDPASLDMVDQVLGELQLGLREIDSILGGAA